MERQVREEADEECMADQSSTSPTEDEVAMALKDHMDSIIGSKAKGPNGSPCTIIAVDPEDQLLPIKIQYDDDEMPKSDWVKCENVYCVLV